MFLWTGSFVSIEWFPIFVYVSIIIYVQYMYILPFWHTFNWSAMYSSMFYVHVVSHQIEIFRNTVYNSSNALTISKRTDDWWHGGIQMTGVYAETRHQAAAPVPDARARSQLFNSLFLQSPSITTPITAFPPRAAILQHTNHSSHCVCPCSSSSRPCFNGPTRILDHKKGVNIARLAPTTDNLSYKPDICFSF